jgi:hypothetical protein
MLLARNSTIVALFLSAALLGGCSKSEKGGPPGSESAGDPEEAVKKCLAAYEKQDVEAIWSLAPAPHDNIEEMGTFIVLATQPAALS